MIDYHFIAHFQGNLPMIKKVLLIDQHLIGPSWRFDLAVCFFKDHHVHKLGW